jgi:hypothetical protein
MVSSSQTFLVITLIEFSIKRYKVSFEGLGCAKSAYCGWNVGAILFFGSPAETSEVVLHANSAKTETKMISLFIIFILVLK